MISTESEIEVPAWVIENWQITIDRRGHWYLFSPETTSSSGPPA